jgi:putative peptide zinc metalloprotease protein
MTGSGTAFFSSFWFRVARLRPRLRPDVRVRRHRYRGEVWYVIADGSTGQLHRFTAGAFDLISRMNGARSVGDIWTEIVQKIGRDAPSQDDVIRLLSQLHRADLLHTDVPPDIVELENRSRKRQTAIFLAPIKNPLAIRLPLGNPDALLNHLEPLARMIFSPLGLFVWLFLVTAALITGAIHYADLTRNLSDQILSAGNLVLIALLHPALKVVHELGHGLAAKAFGARVNGIGVMLLIFIPVPYVDASDAGLLANRYHRAIIAAAGMMFELFVAAFAMFLWVMVEPGTLTRAVAFNVILIAATSTLLFNMNPLLRFDGYFIVCDLLQSPNLGTRSNEFWIWLAKRNLLGLKKAIPPRVGRGEVALLAFYAPLALVYRIFIGIGIALFVAQAYFIVGVILGLLSLAQTLLWPILKGLRYLCGSPELVERRARAVGLTLAGAVVLMCLLWLTPFPHKTSAQGVVWLPQGTHVRSSATGYVTDMLVLPDQPVSVGAPLLTLDDPALHARLKVLEARARMLELQANAEWVTNRSASQATEAELAQARLAVEHLREQRDRMLITSMAEGRLTILRANDLPGRFLREGDLIGYVLPASSHTIRVVVEQAEVELIRSRLRGVSIRIADGSGRILSTDILRDYPAGTRALPSPTLGPEGGGPIALDTTRSDNPQTLHRLFELDLALPPAVAGAYFGTRVHVRFELEPEPLGWQLYRTARLLLLRRLEV